MSEGKKNSRNAAEGSQPKESLHHKIKRIVESNDELDSKQKQLYELGLSKSDIRQVLVQEIVKKERSEVSARNSAKLYGANARLKSKSTTEKQGQMKCLAIRQPWATLVVAGIKDVELRTAMVPPTSKFLIAASATRDAKYLDDLLNDEQMELVAPYIESGALPPCKDWPTSAIIGWVELDRVTYDEVDSPWARGYDDIKYVIKKAYMFKEPIRGKNKATPFFYNVEGIDEDNMPEVIDVTLKK